MKKLWIVGAVVLVVIVLVVLNITGKTVGTASKMADQTVFNASGHVYSYEDFHRKWQQYQQYELQASAAQRRIDGLLERGVQGGQEYSNAVMERDGAEQMMRRIAADYNAASDIGYKGVWKSKGLPKKIGLL